MNAGSSPVPGPLLPRGLVALLLGSRKTALRAYGGFLCEAETLSSWLLYPSLNQ